MYLVCIVQSEVMIHTTSAYLIPEIALNGTAQQRHRVCVHAPLTPVPELYLLLPVPSLSAPSKGLSQDGRFFLGFCFAFALTCTIWLNTVKQSCTVCMRV